MTKPAVAAGLLLFALNWYVCGKLASIEFLHHMHSIEGSFIAVSRYIGDNWRDLTWFPLWYAGIPFQNAYFPLLPLLTAGLAGLSGLAPAQAFHALCAVFYCLGPVTLFWLAWRLSGSTPWSFAVGLLYSTISPSALLLPNIRQDLGSAWYAQRLHAMVFYGDGPFIASLTLVPLALLALDWALGKRSPLAVLTAALAMAAVVLTNLLGGAILGMAIAAYLIAFRLWDCWRSLPLAAAIAVVAYAIASPLMPPSTIATFRFNSATIGGLYQPALLHIAVAGALLVLTVALHFLFDKLKAPGHLRMALYFLLFMGAIVFASAWWDFSLAPQPMRYHVALETAICLAVPFLVQPVWARLPRPAWALAAAVAITLLIAQVARYRRYAEDLIRPIDIRTTTEYTMARWFDRNLPGARIMAPGTVSFYMNNFTDTPQLGGGAEQGTPNWENRVALYVLYSDQNAGERAGEISVLWLKAFGVRAVAVGGPASGEFYKPFVHPRKFEGLLPEIWRDGDDRVYAVPGRSASLAHAVRLDDVVSTPPIHGLDVRQVERYVAALENPDLPLAEMTWTSRHSASIDAQLERGQILSVQVTYHPGWRAVVNGARRPVRADGIGLMAIDPQCEGACAVELVYDGGMEMKLARTASLAALAGCLGWAAVRSLRRRRAERA